MTGVPSLTLLHLGPGFANGIANLHNARRARTPIVNLIGEHATWHDTPDSPLASDIESLAAPVSGWVGRSSAAAEMPGDLATAIAQSQKGAGQISTLILPHDLQIAEGAAPVAPLAPPARAAVSEAAVARAREAIERGDALLFLGNAALSEAGLRAAGRIAALRGVQLMSQMSNARAERGAGLPLFTRLPYFPERALAALAPYRTLVLAGANAPVTFFGWPGYASSLVPEGTTVETLAGPDDDIVAALEALAEALGAKASDAPRDAAPPPLECPSRSTGPITAECLTATLAALQPEGAIVVNEAVTSGWNYHAQSMSAPRFTELQITGGAIGCGPPLSLGAALACPGRPVLNLQADGSALYTPQALWSQAREGTHVITLICSNRRYRILQTELERAGLNRPGPTASELTDLARPTIDWPALARGFGVPACSVENAEDLADAMERALAGEGPYLIEAVLA
jgi:acetolactate synthase-1/2/3 large subunit